MNTDIMLKLVSLEDKIAVISGGASGIGLGTAKRLIEFGAKVAILDINDESGAQAVKEIQANGGEAHAKAIDKAVFPGQQGGPQEHAIAAKALAFAEAATAEFNDYGAQIVSNASVLAKTLAEEGFRLVSGGTDNHLLLVDLQTFDAELTGKEAQIVLDEAGITLNRNSIPNDPRSPFVTSGVRIGTPAVTTQGMKESEMVQIGQLIARTLRERTDAAAIAAIREEVRALCAPFAPYPDLLRGEPVPAAR